LEYPCEFCFLAKDRHLNLAKLLDTVGENNLFALDVGNGAVVRGEAGYRALVGITLGRLGTGDLRRK